jgi:hypothetical protein
VSAGRLHYAHALVCQLGAAGEVARSEHPLVRQHAPSTLAALPLDLQRHHRREPLRQHAHGLVGGLPAQHQPLHHRIMHRLPPTADQPHRGGGFRETEGSLGFTVPPVAALAPSLPDHPAAPPTRPPPSPPAVLACVASEEKPDRRSAARRASACHRPPARVNVPHPALPPLCVGCASPPSVAVAAQAVSGRNCRVEPGPSHR